MKYNLPVLNWIKALFPTVLGDDRMLPVQDKSALHIETLTDDVEALLNPAEAEGAFRDGAECSLLLLLLGAVLLSPPAPRPKRG
jgi:hypothetical protein